MIIAVIKTLHQLSFIFFLPDVAEACTKWSLRVKTAHEHLSGTDDDVFIEVNGDPKSKTELTNDNVVTDGVLGKRLEILRPLCLSEKNRKSFHREKRWKKNFYCEAFASFSDKNCFPERHEIFIDDFFHPFSVNPPYPGCSSYKNPSNDTRSYMIPGDLRRSYMICVISWAIIQCSNNFLNMLN